MKLFYIINHLVANHALLLRFQILRKIGKILLPKYRFKWPQMGWWDDPFFNEYLIKFDELGGMNTDRRWALYQLLRLVENIPGDTAECGVYKGAGSYIICKLNQENKRYRRIHHMFDSFEGLSKPSEHDGKYWRKGDLSSPLERLNKNLSGFDEIRIHSGWIPARFSEVEQQTFCFVHIDVDLYVPTLECLEFFYTRTNEGGVIVCDDYGFSTCAGASKAVDQFLQNKKEKMISLSGGGGFLIKGVETTALANYRTIS